jgi:hypothetical protein
MRTLFFLACFNFFVPLYAQLPQKVIICGVCKDVADRVSYSIKIVEKIGALFSDYRIIVYENNSSDETPRILKEWELSNSKVRAITEQVDQKELEKIFVNRLENNDFYRAETIARARNIALDNALSETYQDFAYVIWMDMDFKLEPDYEGFREVFESGKEWDAVFAYGIDPPGTYWDWYAFRDQECPIGSELLGNDWWYLPKQKRLLNKNDDWYPVLSAFGGCGVYKKSSLKGCRYSGLVTRDLALLSHKIITENPSHPIIQKYLQGLTKLTHITLHTPSSMLTDIHDPKVGILTPGITEDIVWRMSSFVYKYPSVCEHVTFHASMILNGYAKLFINPRLIFRYGG